MKQGIDPAIAAKADADWDRFIAGRMARALRRKGAGWDAVCGLLGERRATLERWSRLDFPDHLPDGTPVLRVGELPPGAEPVQ
jgi:hypothetical protein